MNLYESAEDYLERILMLQLEGKNVRSIDIAESFGYSRASVSRAIKNLKNDGYITMNENGFIFLSPTGKEIAQKIYHRHQLLSEFFERLGVPHDIAIKDACKIEHDLSEETFEAIIQHAQRK